MPVLTITTNAEFEKDTATLLKELSQTVAHMIGKPERYVMISLIKNNNMLFAGNAESLAYLEFKSIDLPENSTASFSKLLCEMIGEKLAIKPDRIYIEFSNAQRHLFGWNGATF